MSEQDAPAQPERSHANRRFGKHVKSCRRARGLTQEVLAERSDLSSDTVRRLEQGHFSPSLHTLRKLCKGLQLSVTSLFRSFELDEREPSRELIDAFAYISPDAQAALLELVAALRRDQGEGED